MSTICVSIVCTIELAGKVRIEGSTASNTKPVHADGLLMNVSEVLTFRSTIAADDKRMSPPPEKHMDKIEGRIKRRMVVVRLVI